MIKKTLGGDRLGSGKQMKVGLHNYERSSHDLSTIWRSTMSPGTLVPFMVQLGLPGDTFDINMGADVKTYPTVGPLFGSFKLQLDVFSCPIRLYQGQLHNNKLGIGMNMSKVKLPQIEFAVVANTDDRIRDENFRYINPSSIHAYLGNRGLGTIDSDDDEHEIRIQRNAIPYLGYWDIYKNYYANKQEEVGYVIHGYTVNWNNARIWQLNGTSHLVANGATPTIYNETVRIVIGTTKGELNADNIEIYSRAGSTGTPHWRPAKELFNKIKWRPSPAGGGTLDLNDRNVDFGIFHLGTPRMINQLTEVIALKEFDLNNIDDVRENILANATNTAPYIVDYEHLEPYSLTLKPITYKSVQIDDQEQRAQYYTIASAFSQEGLGIKTYQSDIFNNWLSTEWIDGANGISAVTAIDTSDGSFTIDTLNLSKKVYDMLNRIAVSGGSYDDWMEAVWTHQGYRKAESPIYHGGLSKEVIFQEVTSTADAGDENPLGTLAGKGRMSDKHKGGQVTIKIDEPCYIIGIVSLTPRIDYSQGNNWDVHLKTMDDFHKPALDQIGFQELITDNMTAWDTRVDDTGKVKFNSAGKQPAWLNYMTNYNRCFGNFADPSKEMYMTLNRRYEKNNAGYIKDLTTYIDPSKFNYLFSQIDLSSQNFWVQIALDITARRKMSSKLIPNL